MNEEEFSGRVAHLKNLPAHVAVIMDGNGRWAQKYGHPRTKGHEAGFFRALEITEAAQRSGIRHLTLYAFSKENWQRSKDEVGFLMGLLRGYFEGAGFPFSPDIWQKAGHELRKQPGGLKINLDDFLRMSHAERMAVASEIMDSVRLRVIGNLEDLPRDLQQKIQSAVEKSRSRKGLEVTLAISYSSRLEILGACRRLAAEAAAGKLLPEQIDEDAVSSRLHTAGVPDPDLLIRTSGEYRVSNFLLWQLSYSEIYVTQKFWPEFSADEFLKALEEYQKRDRRFGKLEGAGRAKA